MDFAPNLGWPINLYAARLRQFADQVAAEAAHQPSAADALLLQSEGLKGLADSMDLSCGHPDPVHLEVELSSENADVLSQVASRLRSQFRACDQIIPAPPTGFLIVFYGPREALATRCQALEPWISGRYTLESGASIPVTVTFRLQAPVLTSE